jgi:hypothetical protein
LSGTRRSPSAPFRGGHWHDYSAAGPATTQDRIDHRSTDAAIAIGERMHGLELGMRGGSLRESWRIAALREDQEQ